MQIYLGTQGIPASVRVNGGNIIDGLYALHTLGLNALEIDFVHRIYLNNEECKLVGDIAKKLGIRLSIHAPYYINLSSENKSVIEASKRRILLCIERARYLNAEIIAVHAAFYGRLNKEDVYKRVREELKEICSIESDAAKYIGIETLAKSNQFGTLDEVIRLYDDLGIKPYIDFAHIFARSNGNIDYGKILDLIYQRISHLNAHFEGLRYKNGKYVDIHAPIGEPSFEPLAIELMNRKESITIICESPLLEIDCMKMRSIFSDVNLSYK
ncbi:MAG: TIM barrel protein [Candidatus Nitrosocaldaceae archaeon]